MKNIRYTVRNEPWDKAWTQIPMPTQIPTPTLILTQIRTLILTPILQIKGLINDQIRKESQ
jgi:hypothetical protein